LPALSNADLRIVIGRLTPATIRRIAGAFPEVNIIVTNDWEEASSASLDGGAPVPHAETMARFVGRTFVLYTTLRNYGLAGARLSLDEAGAVTDFKVTPYWLREDVPDDPGVRRALAAFYDVVGRTAEAQGSVVPPFAGDSLRMSGKYAGAAECRSCHEAEHAQWVGTKHADAFKTLLDVHRHYQPKCVSCHVVGFGAKHGYRLGDAEAPLGNVQCEVCHGPGDAHAKDPSTENIVKLVPERVCLECHNPEHSDNFVYRSTIDRVRHDRADLARVRDAAGH
jgi:hypothetical protein